MNWSDNLKTKEIAMKTRSASVLALIAGLPLSCFAQTILRVDATQTGTPPDGSTWAKAYPKLQQALAHAVTISSGAIEIWIAQGTYAPDTTDTQVGGSMQSWSQTFTLPDRTSLYGAFVGTETSRDPRDPTTHFTILSGDLSHNDTTSGATCNTAIASTRHDNVNNVLTIGTVSTRAHIDGLYVMGGYSTDRNPYTAPLHGAGVLCDHTDVEFSRVGIEDNHCENDGGNGAGIYATYSTIRILDCAIAVNSAGGGVGGGLFDHLDSLVIDGCEIAFNATSANGGGLEIDDCADVTITDSSIHNNCAQNGGGLELNNSTISFDDVHISSNLASVNGAGLETSNSTLSVANCFFVSNDATQVGGAIKFGGTGSSATVSCSNTLFDSNSSGAYNVGTSTLTQGWGGAINVFVGTLNLTHCTFASNLSFTYGGAIAGRAAVVQDCEFRDNVAWVNGGAVWEGFTAGNTAYSNCAFRDNAATNSFGVTDPNSIATGAGGAIWCADRSSGDSATIVRCSFDRNSGTLDGGIYFYATSVHPAWVVSDCRFAYCDASTSGGAMLKTDGALDVRNCTIAFNSAGSDSGGIADQTPSLYNTILWGNTAPSGPQLTNNGDSGGGIKASAYNCCIEGTYSGNATSVINSDPLFMANNSSTDFDLHLRNEPPNVSPCYDAGNNSNIPSDVTDEDRDTNTTEVLPLDLDGLVRVRGRSATPVVDLGAYEGCTNDALCCYANCDGSTSSPFLNTADFTCFLQKYAAGDPYANCDESTQSPIFNLADLTCFLQKFAAGCS